jgi:hypothetical protein
MFRLNRAGASSDDDVCLIGDLLMSARSTAGSVNRRVALAAILGSVALGAQVAGAAAASATTPQAAVVPAGHAWQAVVPAGHAWQAVILDGHAWQ